MPAITDPTGLYRINRNAIRKGVLRGDSDLVVVYGIGPYLSGRAAAACRDVMVTVDVFLRYIAKMQTATSSYNRLTRVLQNERAGRSIAWKNSPLSSNEEEGRAVVADFHTLGYKSIRALMCVLRDTPRVRRRAAGFTVRIMPEAVPPSISDRHPASHCPGLTAAACNSSRPNCRFVQPRQGDDGPALCVPANLRVLGPAPVGSEDESGMRPARAQRRDQRPPVRFDPASAMVALPRRRRYTHGWRVPSRGRMQEMPFVPPS
jgi:hypothetical protein